MAISRAKKEEILAELKAAFGDAKGVAFAKYSGLTVSAFQGLRSNLRAKGVKTKVAKKTLIKLAAKEYNLEISDKILDGPIAIAFSMEDEIAAAQELYKFAKTSEALELTGGISDGKVVGQDTILQLAQLPSKEELLARLVGSLQSPISGFHTVLHGTMRGFVQVCKQLSEREQK
jgi:large subunit ribosomal protein L10